jgi:peroxiredoxin family protein
MEKLAIIVRDDAYDKVLTPLAFAYLASASNIEVDMLFVNWAVRYLGKDLSTGPCSHPGTDEWVASQVAKAGLPPDPREIIKALKATGKVHLYACSLASQIFGVNEQNLIPEADGIIGATWFLLEKANGAHTQYF